MLTIGIQGGRGSFNEEAALTHLPQILTVQYELRYLYRTPNVLMALDKGEIDRAQFAIFNTLGGLYEESLYAIAEHTFKIVDKYAIKIRHSLMIREDAELNEITTIMTQVTGLLTAEPRETTQSLRLRCKSCSLKVR